MHCCVRKTMWKILYTSVLWKFGAVAGQQQEPPLCQPMTIEVSQGHKTVFLGQPVAINQTIEGFYNLNRGSFGGSLPTGPNTSLVAFHQNTNDCNVGLIVVHSQAGSGAPVGWTRMQFLGMDLSNPTVKDDTETFLLSDRYQYNALADVTTVVWNWQACCSDGLAQELGPNWEGCIGIEATFAPQSVQEWKYISGGLALTTAELELEKSLALCARLTTPTPSFEPSQAPSIQPTIIQSATPTAIPSSRPSLLPSRSPSKEPSNEPTNRPSSLPTRQTFKPTFSPTGSPVKTKQDVPKNQPKGPTTLNPTVRPSLQVTSSPNVKEQGQETAPSNAPASTPVPTPFSDETQSSLCVSRKPCPMWNLLCHFQFFWNCVGF